MLHPKGDIRFEKSWSAESDHRHCANKSLPQQTVLERTSVRFHDCSLRLDSLILFASNPSSPLLLGADSELHSIPNRNLTELTTEAFDLKFRLFVFCRTRV